jgi:hypothetical protein
VPANPLKNQELTMRQTSLQKVAPFAGFILSPVIFSTTALAQTADVPSVNVLSPPAVTANILETVKTNILETVSKNDRVGIQFQGAPRLNQGKLLFLSGTKTDTKDVTLGSCLGSLYIPPNTVSTTTPYTTQLGAKASFISKTTPPAAGLRVIIQNTTPEIDRSIRPYTDREYSQGDRSESFTLKQDITQNSRYLAVTLGRNTFAYQIQRGSQIVESGSFTTLIETEAKADKQPEFSDTHISTSTNSSNHCPNQFEAPQFPDTNVKIPDIEDLKIPEAPPLPPDIQQLLDEYKK